MLRPELKGTKKEVLEYIDELEKIIEGYRDNGAIQFMAALNKQLKKLAIDIASANIQFEKSDDKLYDRFLKTATLGKELISDFRSFLLEYGDQVKTEDEVNKNVNLMEIHWKNKNGKR